MPAPGSFSVVQNPACLRGLHFVYTAPTLVPERLRDTLRRAYPDRLVEGSEPWGPVTVHRMILQFRFEVQLGASAHQISFLHRAFATPAQRIVDRAAFEATLSAALIEQGAP